MTQEQIDYVKKCIREDIHRFYVWGPWKKVRREVLQMDHGECQRCKAKKIYTKATTVHHVNYVRNIRTWLLEIGMSGMVYEKGTWSVCATTAMRQCMDTGNQRRKKL